MSCEVEKIIEQDLQHIWHPCAHMKDFESYPPLVVKRAKGSNLYTNKGVIIDAISSWWCKSLGHGHPAILAAIRQQLKKFEHVITASTTQPELVELGELLAEISNNQHVFFASDGASAVEIALKLAMSAKQLKGQADKNMFIALKNSYHGETLASLSVSDLGIYKKPYEGYGLACHFISKVPYVLNKNDPLWTNADAIWVEVLPELEAIKHQVCAIIVEPILQGAAGMLCYSADFLKKLSNFAKQNNIYLIADEIMTGFGRTGAWLASNHANIQPDLICLSKGLTAGFLPFSCVLISHEIFKLFYDEYAIGRAFLHSHTYSGHALGVACALATIKVIKAEGLNEAAQRLGDYMQEKFFDLADITGKLTNIRSIGAMVAGDLVDNGDKRLGFKLAARAINHGALLRPIANTLYWLPPLNTSMQTIDKLFASTLAAIKEVF